MADQQQTSSSALKKTKPKKKAIFRTQKANLTFPVPRTENKIRKMNPSMRVASSASVYLAAAVEFLAMDFLENAGRRAQERKHKTIFPQDIQYVFETDPEWKNVQEEHAIIEGAGVFPAESMIIRHRDAIKSAERKRKRQEKMSV